MYFLTEERKMVRNYKKKSERGAFGDENLCKALKEILSGTPVLTASKKYGMSPKTLR